MLDTLKIKTNQIQVIKPIKVSDIYGNTYTVDAFSYPEMNIKEKRFIKSKEFIEKTGKYYPSITFRRNNTVFIEFSAPKILFDNNLEELEDTDKSVFVKELSIKLFDMGLGISAEDLLNSEISFATVSKNVFIEGVGASEFIEFTRRLWWKWRHTQKFENYMQNGVAIREFTSTTAIGIYAKLPSLGSIKTKTYRESQLTEISSNNILRFEYRMQNHQRTIAKYSWAKGYKLNILKLEDIFCNFLSKKILLYDLKKSLFSPEFKLITHQLPNIKKMYEHIMNEGLKPQEELVVIGCFRLCSDLGVDIAKRIFDNRYSKSTTKRVWSLCNKVFADYEKCDYQSIKVQIEAELEKFKAIKKGDLDIMLSNKIPSSEQITLI